MMIQVAIRPVARLIVLLSALAGAQVHAERAPQARLVHCGQIACLRLSGHRSRADVAVRVAGADLAVAGNRDWDVTVPLWTARGWPHGSGDALELTYVDPQGSPGRVLDVVLPPGALGRQVELASLMVRAR